MKPFIKAEKPRPVFSREPALFSFLRACYLPTNERAIFFFECIYFRDRIFHGKLFRIACIDSCDERIDRIIEKFLAKPSPDKICDAFFFVLRSLADKRLAGKTKFCTGRKE